jgi:hypothetical protein
MSDHRFMFKYCVRPPSATTRISDNLSLDSNHKPLADLGTTAPHQSKIDWQVKAPPGLSASSANRTRLTCGTPQEYH